jgi:menaquinone-dependent protoporphyrinogen IX oxidase
MTTEILIAYFTKSGASEEYAKIIAEALRANEFSVEVYNLAQNIPDVAAYDTIILGTGVRMFRVYRRWNKVLKQKSMPSKRVFMFLSSGTAIEDPDKAVDKFLRPIVQKHRLTPDSLVSFPGKIPEKWAKLDGEKDTMKPEKATAWAQEIVRQLQSKEK